MYEQLIQHVPFLLAVMIFWDFSLHAIELFGGKKWFNQRKNIFSYWWPKWSGENKRKKYTVFWTVYWGVALLLILFYILA